MPRSPSSVKHLTLPRGAVLKVTALRESINVRAAREILSARGLAITDRTATTLSSRRVASSLFIVFDDLRFYFN